MGGKKQSAKERKKAAIAAQKKEGKGKEQEQEQQEQEQEVEVSVAQLKISSRSVTGAIRRLTVESRDIIVDQFSLTFHGRVLISDCTLHLSSGRRYGIIGPNGCGKSTLLTSLGCGEVPLPSHMDVYHVSHEIAAGEDTALAAVLKVDVQRLHLENEAAELTKLMSDDTLADQINARLSEIYERLDEMDADRAIPRAARILYGLGFSDEMQNKKTKEFSGGWRMRIALARALFIRPTLLLLDEPTNHLDLEACVWLEQYLQQWPSKNILVMISHSQDFLDGVCTNIISIQQQQLAYWGGNYTTYITTRFEQEANQMKRFNWEQDQIAHMKEYIARFGHGSAKRARQAQSKEKTLAKMERGGLTTKVAGAKVLDFRFPDAGKLSPPVLQFQSVSFGFPNARNPADRLLYKDLNFGIDLDSRVALVGPNGVGKSTLLKLMCGELASTEGMVRPHNQLRIARFHQHFVDQMDMRQSPLQYMMSEFGEKEGVDVEVMRAWVGRFGLTGQDQTCPMQTLSDGQKSRVVFCWMAYKSPHMLLLDEPTNHLDMETIDSLASAINEFEGGVVLVSHDMRLIEQVADELWLCANRTVTKYAGSIQDFKEELRLKIESEKAAQEKAIAARAAASS